MVPERLKQLTFQDLAPPGAFPVRFVDWLENRLTRISFGKRAPY